MSIRLEGDRILLEGDCFIEDAESLVSLLYTLGRTVDVSQCRVMHTALLQAMLAFRPRVAGQMGDEVIDRLLAANFETVQ